MHVDRSWKPEAQWNRDDLREEFEAVTDGEGKARGNLAQQIKWLKRTVRPGLAPAVRAVYRERKADIESHLGELAKEVKPDCPDERRTLYGLAKWFLRNYSFWKALCVYLRLLPGGNGVPGGHVLLMEMLMPRVAVSVWIGMLAICGSGPWEFFAALKSEACIRLASSALVFAFLYRLLDVAKRTDKGTFVIAGRAAFLTGLAWIFGFALVWGFGLLCEMSEKQDWLKLIWTRHWYLMPSVGVAVGVVVQEFWEDKPISEPV